MCPWYRPPGGHCPGVKGGLPGRRKNLSCAGGSTLYTGSRPHIQPASGKRQGRTPPGGGAASTMGVQGCERLQVASSSKNQPAGGRGYQEPLLVVWVSKGGVSCPFHQIWLFCFFLVPFSKQHTNLAPVSKSMANVRQTNEQPLLQSHYSLHACPSPR